MSDWLATLDRRLAREPALVRVAVAAVRGSAPREPGACMLVGADAIDDSIGGGHLELKAIEIARQMLAQPAGAASRLDRFALGATLGQCCGGAVNLWFERFGAADRDLVAAAARAAGSPDKPSVLATVLAGDGAPLRALIATGYVYRGDLGGADRARAAMDAAAALFDRPAEKRASLVRAPDGAQLLIERIDPQGTPLMLFGAGHVGKALVKVLAELPFRVHWIDSRADVFPAGLPANVAALPGADPLQAVAAAPPDAMHLVLTHSHDLDYEICRALLRRGDFAWAGLIGSETKATCFALRLARDDVPAERIARLVSPIGIDGIDSKVPAAIAVAVAAQLLQVAQTVARTSALNPLRVARATGACGS